MSIFSFAGISDRSQLGQARIPAVRYRFFFSYPGETRQLVFELVLAIAWSLERQRTQVERGTFMGKKYEQ